MDIPELTTLPSKIPIRSRTWVSALIAIIFGGIVLFATTLQHANDPLLAVHFFDVGQGDGMLIRASNGIDIVIDGGPSNHIIKKIDSVLPFYDRSIELMVLTHPHADHINAQLEILKRYHVEKVLASGVIHTSANYLAWLSAIRDQKIPMTIAQKGQSFNFTDKQEKAFSLSVIYPTQSFEEKRIESDNNEFGGGLNDTSVVARLDYGSRSFLFTGDASSVIEEDLIKQNAPLHADVLKVGHHGSRYSTSSEFVKAVAPSYAVIQVGKNKYGHPTYQTLHNLENAGIKIFRNDRNGDITAITDGTSLDLKSEK